jgi:hypothetical protein
MHALPTFSGSLRKLVLAFDVGTTYSGIAYAILDPGETPRILGVTRYIQPNSHKNLLKYLLDLQIPWPGKRGSQDPFCSLVRSGWSSPYRRSRSSRPRNDTRCRRRGPNICGVVRVYDFMNSNSLTLP